MSTMKPLSIENEYDSWEIQDERIRLDPERGETTIVRIPDTIETVSASCA